MAGSWFVASDFAAMAQGIVLEAVGVGLAVSGILLVPLRRLLPRQKWWAQWLPLFFLTTFGFWLALVK